MRVGSSMDCQSVFFSTRKGERNFYGGQSNKQKAPNLPSNTPTNRRKTALYSTIFTNVSHSQYKRIHEYSYLATKPLETIPRFVLHSRQERVE